MVLKKTNLLMTLFVLSSLLLTALPVLADVPEAMDWLRTQQNNDGGFGDPDSTVGNTADAVQVIVAAGEDPATWNAGGNTPLTFLATRAADLATAGDTAKVILATVAAGENPRDFGVDLVDILEGMRGDDGRFGGENDFQFSQCLALLALKSVSRPIPVAAVDYLKNSQIEDGTWAWNFSPTAGEGDNNSAGLAVMALIAAGEPADGEVIQRAVAHFQGQQNDDGGFPYINPSPYGTDSDANSTAVVLQALIAAGQDPATWVKGTANTPATALAGFQNTDGSFTWQLTFPEANFLATIQAVPALVGKVYPLAITTVGEAATAPETLPVTGADLLQYVGWLIPAGLAMAGTGLFLRRGR